MKSPIMLNTDRYKIPAVLETLDDQYFLNFRYNAWLKDEIKACMSGVRFDPETKAWKFDRTQRSDFRLKYLQGLNPFAAYNQPLVELEADDWPMFNHQKVMAQAVLTYHYVILACEMGTGKTLASIKAMRQARVSGDQIWYIGPKAGVTAVTRELIKWGSDVIPLMYTYEQLTKIMNGWRSGRPAPKFVIFDEASKLKTPTAKRTLAAQALADAVRNEHGKDGYVVLMTGTPAPKSPLDWYSQCEIASPGYIREGDLAKFRNRLALVRKEEGAAGGMFPKIVTWWDDENKCKVCGVTKDQHQMADFEHPWEASTNELAKLYRRMKGMTTVFFKKDCLDLPEKTYEVIKIKPTVEILRAAKLIAQTVPAAAQALIRLRELSDGFQYKEVETGKQTCTLCNGIGTREIKIPKVVSTVTSEIKESDFDLQVVTCDRCGGSKQEPIYERSVQPVGSPKDEYLVDLLDECEDHGRFIVWAGFTASIDRLVELINKAGWDVLRVDGRGYHAFPAEKTPFDENPEALVKLCLDAMDASHPKRQDLLKRFPKLCFIGQPKAGGMALTLTASPITVYYSNDFSGEARFQSEDRFHRAGMDANRAAQIIDFVLLPSDQLVIDNLKKKRDLQAVTLGELNDAMKGTD